MSPEAAFFLSSTIRPLFQMEARDVSATFPTARSPGKSCVHGSTRPSQKMMRDAQRNVHGAYFFPFPGPPISPAQLCRSLIRTLSGGNSLNCSRKARFSARPTFR